MKTEENQISDSLKTLKQFEEKLASSQTHDFLEDEMVIPVQHMFPNCRKYAKCCYDDKEFWNNLQNRVTEAKRHYSLKTYFRIKKTKIKPMKPPEDFEGW